MAKPFDATTKRNMREESSIAAAQARIDGIGSVEKVEYLMDRLFSVETWDDLLAS